MSGTRRWEWNLYCALAIEWSWRGRCVCFTGDLCEWTTIADDNRRWRCRITRHDGVSVIRTVVNRHAQMKCLNLERWCSTEWFYLNGREKESVTDGRITITNLLQALRNGNLRTTKVINTTLNDGFWIFEYPSTKPQHRQWIASCEIPFAIPSMLERQLQRNRKQWRIDSVLHAALPKWKPFSFAWNCVKNAIQFPSRRNANKTNVIVELWLTRQLCRYISASWMRMKEFFFLFLIKWIREYDDRQSAQEKFRQ